MAHPMARPLTDEPASRTERRGIDARGLELAVPRLRRIALALGLPAQDVPDVVQDALLAAHRSRRSFDPARGESDAWLATILVRRVRNARRAERRWRALRTAIGLARRAPEATDTADIDRVEARLVLERLVGCLSDSQREVVALYEIGQLTADEVARALGHTPAGVRSIARDARAKLAAAARRTHTERGGADER